MIPRIRALHPAVPRLGLLAAACGIWVLSGCNVFSPLASDGDRDLTYRGLLLKGNEAVNKKRYAEAEAYYAQAMAKNPGGSEAYLFHSKALMGRYGIDYKSLNGEIDSARNKDGAGKRGLPFLNSATSVEQIDSTYYPVAQSVENLEHILRHARDTVLIPGGWKLLPDGDTAGDGRISEGVARLDLGILQTIKGMLGPLDLDGDNHVGRECGRNLCPGLEAACMEGAAYRAKCKDGPASEVKRFESYKNLTQRLNIDNPDSKDMSAREMSSNPNDINGFLDMMLGPIAASSSNLDSVTGAMKDHNEEKLGGQLSEIVGNISDLTHFLSFMRFNDGADNDFDDQDSSGKGTRMVWHDYDKDGGIRFDYDDPIFAGFLGSTRNGESHNIGHPLHRHLHPELYVAFSDSAWLKRSISRDTSKNSRKTAMIEHCQDVARALDENGAVTRALIDEVVAKTCTTYTSILKSTVRPPSRSDWVSGTFGIDEEEIDQRDNDYDGLQDEDARNAPGMDDDDDAQLDATMVGTTPGPMLWKDSPGHENGCPDIDLGQAMQPAPFSRQFCIGSLEHRIYLAQHGGKDTLKVYYSKFLTEGPSTHCLEDFDKLDSTYKEKVGLKSASDPAVQIACQYKHIWIHGRPPASEWTDGIYGIDEELPDGKDNDGDGWVDEDMK